MKKLMLLAAGLSLALAAAAQEPEGHEGRTPRRDHHPRTPLSVETEAHIRLDKMRAEIELTDAQAEQVLDVFKEDIEHFRSNMPARPEKDQNIEHVERPERPARPELTDEQKAAMKQHAEEKEKKLRAIIGDEKYEQWLGSRKEARREHPEQDERQGRPEGDRRQGRGHRHQGDRQSETAE